MNSGGKNHFFTYDCDYCGKEFHSAKDAKEHESHCRLRPLRVIARTNPAINVEQGIKLGFGFAIGVFLFGIMMFAIATILGFSLLGTIFH